MSVSKINTCCYHRMKTKRTICQRRGGEDAGTNQVPPQSPAEGVAMPVNRAGLTDAEVQASLAQMSQAITMRAQPMTDQINRQNVQMENPLVCSMAERLRDFTRMNPPIFPRSMTLEDSQEFVDEVHKFFVAMGAKDTDKEELISY